MSPERRLSLFIFARIVVTFLLLASTIVLNLQDPKAIDDLTYSGMVRLMAFSFLFSVGSYFFVKIQQYRFFVTYLQTIWDLLFVTVLLLFTGGVTSPYSFLYLLSIMNAGVLLGRREALYTASLCGILYGSIIDLQYFGLLETLGLSQSAAQLLGPRHIFYNIFLNLMGFYLTAFITGYMSGMARESEQALREKTVDYDELERLSTMIVSNVESGLMTITSGGKVRVFNRYAEELTGKSQAEVYDVALKNVFPDMSGIVEKLDGVANGEFECNSFSDRTMILGYTAVPFTDLHGNSAGVIVNFKDLTAIKRMEEALKRADRLATLGELSARMAHEIRNPLAAMGGAVQLLAEHGSILDNDQRLLTIITREADRLNELISDFLAYAKPASPRRERFELRELVEDIRILIDSDQRFADMNITNSVPAHLTISADPNQLRQILINLLHNAAEATEQKGDVVVDAFLQLSGADGFKRTPAAVITVTDNGPGMSEESIAHLFEPFWTTKSEGTGLGLAIIYRIVETHGGRIKAEPAPDGGCRIVITLPA